MNLFESLAEHGWIADVLLLLLVCLLSIRLKLLNWLESWLARFAERRRTALVILFLGPIALRLALLPQLPAPKPAIHDEFSYLLMADTFAHGRLSNPPHPMWKSFETFHVLWFPSYASKYPPAQGAVLALGEIFGSPWIGVILSAGAMCAAIAWALQAWMPARWAGLAAFLAAVKLCVATYWMNSYWGGTVAAAGGALILGAAGRLLKGAKARDALLLGIGVAIVANSRPFEGLLLCLPVFCLLLWRLISKAKSREVLRSRAATILLPAGSVLVAAAIFMGYYNWRVTGKATLPPYFLAAETDPSALFIWQHAKAPVQTQVKAFDEFFNGWERRHYDRTWSDLKRVSLEKLELSGGLFGWPEALLIAAGTLLVFRDRRTRFLLAVFFIVIAGHFASAWSNPHYIAPITCVIYGLMAQSIRHLRTMRWAGVPAGAIAARFAIVALVVSTGMLVKFRVSDARGWGGQGLPGRAQIEEQLERMPGKQLVLVRYLKNHSMHQEWVYNGADIDGSKIVWARELDAEQNARLAEYFSDRKIWLVRVSFFGALLEPYSPEGIHSAPETGE